MARDAEGFVEAWQTDVVVQAEAACPFFDHMSAEDRTTHQTLLKVSFAPLLDSIS